MLSGDQDLPDGIGMARLAWTRLPTAEGSSGAAASASAARDELFVGAVESLDYEVIENYAYREEQVRAHFATAVPTALVVVSDCP
jgi:chloride channel 7